MTSWKVKKYKIKSEAPVIMHNGDLADPSNEFTKQSKEYEKKKKRDSEKKNYQQSYCIN